MDDPPASIDPLLDAIAARRFTVGIIGLGYVGLPLAKVFCEAGFPVLGFDVDPAKIERLNAGGSYIRHIADATVAEMRATGRFAATADMARLGEPDALLVCVPTPLSRHREPDTSYVEATARDIAAVLRRGQLVVLESTSYPGTTAEVMAPILESGGLRAGHDVFVASSPEREDPGNAAFATGRIPKVVGGDTDAAGRLAAALYTPVVASVVAVRDTRTAEAVKLTENIFRSVNIALVNELKQIYDAMGIDVWEVIDAAKTKPFGYMPFYPGPGLGGHCIPIDPFYLTWKAREVALPTRFIELSGEINQAMPRHVVRRVAEALNDQQARALNGARILVIGLAYKKNVDDVRESPGLKLIELLEAAGATVAHADPHVPVIPPTREHAELTGRAAVPPTAATVAAQHAVLIATDHDAVDYALLHAHAPLIVDTRNVMARHGLVGAHVVKA
jgi:UDP-N-acetyl-D-glucosamine dehydrogenase